MNPAKVPTMIILFGALFPLVLATGQLALKKKNRHNLILTCFYLSVGLFQLANSLPLLSQSPAMWAGTYGIIFPMGITAFFCIAPLQYLYFRTILTTEKITRKDLLHFIPALMSFTVLIMAGPEIPSTLSPEHYRNFIIHNSLTYRIITQISVILFGAYGVVSLKKFPLHLRESTTNKIKLPKIYFWLQTSALLLCLLWFASFLFTDHLVQVVHLLLTLYIIFMYIADMRYASQGDMKKQQNNTYLRSQISDLDTTALVEELTTLMTREKLYRREDIKIKDLAAALNISTHQLSELLNTCLKKNFHTYIRELRITDAMELLKEKPEQSILDITYGVGYNSTSAFYNAFKRVTGMSPSQYREEQKKTSS